MTRRAVKLTHLIAHPFPASPIRSRGGDLGARARRGGGAPDRFERRVFRYLATHRREHGIATVHKLGNVRVDGMVVLQNGRRLVVETKYRMGWLKACQAEWQVGDLLQRPEGRKTRPTSALIIFEAFAGDWARRWKSGKTEKGWIHWYVGHARLPGRQRFRLDLVRFQRGRLESFPR